MTGEEIRGLVFSKGFRLWQVADVLGMTDNKFSRRLRKPFNDEEVAKVKAALKTLEEERLAKLTK